ncbi:MAG: AAA family ATPase [Acidimicrobiales bacterium]|nr:AAA family ATPase [Acidimicrobiales bacterium]
MRIHRLAIRNFRGVDSFEIDLPADGVTIIEGGNEVGKSSLAEALDLVFAFPDNSKSAAIRQVQPVHRDVGPEVEVELTTGGYRLVYSKRWLRRPSTTLSIVEPSREQQTGRDAHDRVNQILDQTLDRDLWNVLRLEQGGDLSASGFVLPSLSRALEATVGADLTGPGEDDLWDRIVAERDHYWTPTGRPSAERTRLAERVEEAVAAVSAIESQIREVEARTDEFARLEAEAVDLAARQVDLVQAEAEAAGRLEALDGLRQELVRVEADAQRASSDHQRWSQLGEARARLVESVARREAALLESEQALAESEPERADAERALARLTIRRREAADALRGAELAADQAAADATYRRRQIEVAQFRERLERVVDAQAELERVELVLAGVEITPDTVVAMEAAQLELARAEAAAEAGAAVVSAVAQAGIVLEVDGQPVPLAPGDQHTIAVAAATEISVPGQVELTVSAGADSRVRAEKLQEARNLLTELCRRHGVADLDEARRIAAARADAERTRTYANERLVADLRDLSVDGLANKIASLSVRIAEFEASRAPVPALPADLGQAQKVEASTVEVLGQRRSDFDDTEADLEAAQARTRELGESGAARLERVKMDRAALSDALEVLAAARVDHPDDQIAEQVELASAVRKAAEVRLAEAERSLALADPDTLDALAESTRRARERGEAATRENRDQRRSLTAVIEHTGEQGLAHRLDLALAEADRLKLEAERLEGRAHAARLLHDTFDRHRTVARQKYVAPFREQIERLGRLVYGPSLEIELDDQLGISSRTLNGVTVGFDQLSTGAREQFALLSRLACASLVSGNGEGAPVVFDDALGWTDPQRLGQMAAAISVAARQCQVIVLTCTPGRFAGVGAASVVRLGSSEAREDPSLTA